MNELTPQEREFLAVDVMGWYLNSSQGWYEIDINNDINISDWKPDQNIEQAFMLLKSFNPISIYQPAGEDVWLVNINSSALITVIEADTLELAICRAVLAARGK